MELKIREEVCQEMAEQIVEIEKNYKLVHAIIFHRLTSWPTVLVSYSEYLHLAFFSERMMEEQRATEELYEKRMDILSQSVKKARKRPRVERIEDDDDEWISSVVLHKEQVKNKVL